MGNLSLKALTKTELNARFRQLGAGHILVAAKRVFAAAPGLAVAHVVVLELATSDGVLMAASVRRESLARLRGERTEAVELLDLAADQVLVRTGGAARTLLPLEVLGGSELREVRAALQRRPGPPAPVTTVLAYQIQPSPNDMRVLQAGGAEPAGVVPVGPVPVGPAQAGAEPPTTRAVPVESVSPPPRAHRKRYVAAAVILVLLGAGWLSSLGADSPAPRFAGEAALPDTIQKDFTVQQVRTNGLIVLAAPTGFTRQVELEHVLLPTGGDCLASEASAGLTALLPVGAVVAGHETGELTVDGVLVAAELAREGLAVADPTGATTDAEYRAIVAAQEQAREAQAGMYSPATACTLPAQLTAYAAATAGLSTEAEAVIALAALEQTQLDGLTTHIDDATRTHSTLAAFLAGSPSKLPLAAFTAGEVETMRTQVSEGESILANAVTRTNERIGAENARIQAEADKAAETQRLAGEQAAREEEAQPKPAAALEPWNMPGADPDCSDIRKKVRITGIDYHRLDRDGDGACESYG